MFESDANAIAADINYLDHLELYSKEKPYTINFDVTHLGLPRTNHVYSSHNVSVFDARPIASSFSLEVQGFQWCKWPTSLSTEDYEDDNAVRNVAYPEVFKYLQKLFPEAEEMHVMAHRRRHSNPRAAGFKPSVWSLPVGFAHIDYTTRGAILALEPIFKENRDLRDRRFEIINVWRVFEGASGNLPYTLCDDTTTDPQVDLEPNDRIFRDSLGENLRAYFNPQHKWYYLSNQRSEEVLLYRGGASSELESPSPLHTEVKLPSVTPKSEKLGIEIRVALFFP